MLAPVLVFFAVAGLVVGVYFGAMWFSATMEGRKLARRLREVGQSPDAPDAALVMDRPEGPLPQLDGLVNRTAAGSRLSRLIEQSGVRTTASGMLMASLAVVRTVRGSNDRERHADGEPRLRDAGGRGRGVFHTAPARPGGGRADRHGPAVCMAHSAPLVAIP